MPALCVIRHLSVATYYERRCPKPKLASEVWSETVVKKLADNLSGLCIEWN